MAGYSGRGRQNRRTNGPIQPAYSLGGYHTFLPTANTPTFVANVAPILEHHSGLFRTFINTLVTVKDLLAYLLSLQLDMDNTRFYSWRSLPRSLMWVYVGKMYDTKHKEYSRLRYCMQNWASKAALQIRED